MAKEYGSEWITADVTDALDDMVSLVPGEHYWGASLARSKAHAIGDLISFHRPSSRPDSSSLDRTPFSKMDA